MGSGRRFQADAELLTRLTRRELLGRVGIGVGPVALTWLLHREAAAAGHAHRTDPLRARPAPYRPRVRSVIHLHMVGAPSQLDLFDPKPVLRKYDGEPCPKEFIEGKRFAFLRGHPKLLGSPFRFRPCGESGIPLSELLPHLGSVVDRLAFVKTVRTSEFNHGPAQLFLHTGFPRFGRPSMGAWVTYGLGTENENLPAYVVMITGQKPGAGNALWGAGFLPSIYQGVEFRSKGDPVLFLSNPAGVTRQDRRRILDATVRLNRQHLALVGDPEIQTRIGQYELAFRMQTAVPDLMDIRQEPLHILKMYGADPARPSFANNCLLARRLVERGVRFVQLFDQGWDHHSGLAKNLPNKCRQVDRPVAALIRDLDQRGLLDETLVVWAAEFGRTPMLQGSASRNAGRDHHREAFTVWFAGGGIRGGTVYGQTDDLGYYPAENPVDIHDLHATMLHLLGIDHTKLTYRFQGREFRLTDIGGRIITGILV